MEAYRPDSKEQDRREHELTLQVFTVSAGMVGVCLAAIGILRVVVSQTQVQTLGDDLLAIDAVAFLASCFLAFWSFKAARTVMRRRLRNWADATFLLGLAGMAGTCSVIAWAIF